MKSSERWRMNDAWSEFEFEHFVLSSLTGFLCSSRITIIQDTTITSNIALAFAYTKEHIYLQSGLLRPV